MFFYHAFLSLSDLTVQPYKRIRQVSHSYFVDEKTELGLIMATRADYKGRGKASSFHPRPCFSTYLVHPVLAVMVLHALIQRPSRQHQNKIASRHDTLDELILEFAGFQLLHVDEDAEAMQLQVHLQEAAEGRGSTLWRLGPKSQAPNPCAPSHLASWDPEFLR